MKIITIIFLIPLFAFAGTEGMKEMKVLKPKSINTVKGNENFDQQKGFGDQEPQIKMKNLMMVGGSGMEGMEMESTKLVASKEQPEKHTHQASTPTYDFKIKTPEHLKVGKNLISITIQDEKNGKFVEKLKLKSEVYMTSMDMGTETPTVKEMKNGVYQLNAPFSMKGPWAIKIIFMDGNSKVFNLEVK